MVSKSGQKCFAYDKLAILTFLLWAILDRNPIYNCPPNVTIDAWQSIINGHNSFIFRPILISLVPKIIYSSKQINWLKVKCAITFILDFKIVDQILGK